MKLSKPLAGLRIALISAWASRLGGGVFEAMIAQSKIITAAGGEPVIFALDDDYCEVDRHRLSAIEVRTFAVLGPRQIGYAPGLQSALREAKIDCIHLLGIWMYPTLAASKWAISSGKGYVVSPHGMLDSWITRRGRLKKSLARAGYERSSWKAASFLHALTAQEAADIERESGRKDSLIIPNAAPSAALTQPATRCSQVAYIGRIHPKKNLLALVEGWAQLARPDGASLTIAGWGDPADVSALEAVVKTSRSSVRFIGPIYGSEKEALLARSKFVVLPSHSEGLPMAVLEGWAASTPSIMTRHCNLPEGFAANAAIECGESPAEIQAALAKALALKPAEWLAMSANAKALATGPFSAHAVGSLWADAYTRAIEMGSAVA